MNYITTKKFSELAGVSIGTIRYWLFTNKISYIKTSGGHRYYCIDDVNCFLNEKIK